MEAGLNLTESKLQSDKSESSFWGARAVGDEASGELRARELGAWLCALRTFFQTRNHAFTEAERAEISTRDFVNETLIVQQVLLRCSQLVLELISGETSAPVVEAGGGDVDTHAPFGEGANASEENASRGSLLSLGEALRDAWALGGGLMENGAVGFYEWSSWGQTLLRELDSSGVGKSLTHESRRKISASLQTSLHVSSEGLTTDSFYMAVFAVFSRIILLLERLRFVGVMLERDQPLKQTLPLFTLVYEETRDLLEVIENRALRTEGLSETVYDALDGTAYAIRMELRKTFEHELVGLSALRPAPSLYAKVETAHGLLRDCFQQSAVALAQPFGVKLDGARFFNNFQTRLEQSLTLRRDLWSLLELARRAEQERERGHVAPLLERLNLFREASMRYLMYKDWESFERFVDEIIAARGAVELGPVMHRFSAYLETLFGQISMRAALADHPFDFPRAED